MICYNLLLSLSPVCVEDSADQHAAVCSLPDLIHEPGRLDNGGQAPPYRRCVCKDQARTMGKLVGHFFLFYVCALFPCWVICLFSRVLFSVWYFLVFFFSCRWILHATASIFTLIILVREIGQALSEGIQ